jgi:hypothetical protein
MKLRLTVDVESDGMTVDTLLWCLTGTTLDVVKAAIAREVYVGSSMVAPKGSDVMANAHWQMSRVELEDAHAPNVPPAVRSDG